ncbi:hypothetical protein H7F51_02465 [Novosphingobium flavum]|uniref:Uncharacterized protein n=1 Tax=Novosphingobium flavum TaxID=1778672 RepID=A0A7X1KKB6_9SPHN|nr:hypothetical protein [Novosphingobium flavum]MBC2664376.1 hypothetical protein [Novosphingobium flavum]
MKALTQCWFTRMHVLAGRAHREEDGSHTGYCRHCERAIVSWDRSRWFLADGFNVTHLAETVGGRFLFVLDSFEEAVIARYPVPEGADAAALEALRKDLAERHSIDRPGSGLELHDSGAPVRRRTAAAQRVPALSRGGRFSAPA